MAWCLSDADDIDMLSLLIYVHLALFFNTFLYSIYAILVLKIQKTL